MPAQTGIRQGAVAPQRWKAHPLKDGPSLMTLRDLMDRR
jgi:hypothetical protein